MREAFRGPRNTGRFVRREPSADVEAPICARLLMSDTLLSLCWEGTGMPIHSFTGWVACVCRFPSPIRSVAPGLWRHLVSGSGRKRNQADVSSERISSPDGGGARNYLSMCTSFSEFRKRRRFSGRSSRPTGAVGAPQLSDVPPRRILESFKGKSHAFLKTRCIDFLFLSFKLQGCVDVSGITLENDRNAG